MDPGDREAVFGEFVAARSQALLATAYLLTGDRQHAEDLVQASLLKTYLAWARLRDPERIEAYVRRTMITTNTSWWRRRWRREFPTQDPALQQQIVGVVDAGHTAVTARSELWPLLARLGPRQRTVVVLRFYDDLSESQIAEQMNCSVGTVKSQLSRALASLRHDISQFADDPIDDDRPLPGSAQFGGAR